MGVLVSTLSDFKNATVGFYFVSEKLINQIHVAPLFISYMILSFIHNMPTIQKDISTSF